jgi:Ran GTPase-activating protein (RanGAP) involved in mRNA processing and transport
MKNGKTIDLKNNKIGKIGTEHLSHCLSSKDCWLEELNLEDNMLGDANIMLLLDSILDNNTLRILNISKNYITN